MAEAENETAETLEKLKDDAISKKLKVVTTYYVVTSNCCLYS